MKHRYRPGVESLESKISLSADIAPHSVAALRAVPRLRAAPRLSQQLDPSHFLLQGTVVGFMKVGPGVFTAPGPAGYRNFDILRARGRISELGPVRATGLISEYQEGPHGPATWNPFGGKDQNQHQTHAHGYVILRNFRDTEVILSVFGPDVPPGTALTDGPNYLPSTYIVLNQDYAHYQETAGFMNLSFPRGQPVAYGPPRPFVINILVASKPADADGPGAD